MQGLGFTSALAGRARGGHLARGRARLQIEAWRLSYADKARVTSRLTRAVRALAFPGIRQRHPAASERECLLRFAILTLGAELACRVYPDARALVEL